MKIHHFRADNYLGARAVDLPITQPITLISGENGAGKSSIGNGISFALIADLCRVSKKGDAGQLISEGATAARVSVQTDERDYEVTISKAGKIADNAAGTEPHAALPFVLDPARFMDLDDTERRAFLFKLLGIETSHKAIAERMARRGLDAEKIAAVLPILRAGFGAGERHAKEQASQARGAWKAVSGESYGDKKAEGWEPPAADAAGDATAKAENADTKVREFDEQISALQQEIGAARAAQQGAQQHAAKVQRLRDQVAMIDRIKARLATADGNVASCMEQLAEVDGKSGPIHELAFYLNESLRMAIPFGEMSEYQREILKGAGAALDNYTSAHGEITAPAQNNDPARAEEIRRGLQVAESGAANARRDLASAEAAAAELAELEKNSPAEMAKTADIESRLADAQRRRADWQADARKYRDAAGAAERREKQIADAAEHHADVQQWSAIADALSPDGIQAEMIAEALDPLNKLLAEHAGLAQWETPRLGADMSLTVGGRLYGLLSESECWRADAILAVAIAVLSCLRCVVLDRMDVLDATGREDALYWLSDVAEAGQIDTAIVLATLKSAPPADALPPHIASHWIERGTLIVGGDEPARVAA